MEQYYRRNKVLKRVFALAMYDSSYSKYSTVRLQYGAVQYSTAQCSTLYYSILQQSTVHRSTLQLQCRAIISRQCLINTVRCCREREQVRSQCACVSLSVSSPCTLSPYHTITNFLPSTLLCSLPPICSLLLFSLPPVYPTPTLLINVQSAVQALTLHPDQPQYLSILILY